MERFAKLVLKSESHKLFSQKNSILDVWQGPEYAPDIHKKSFSDIGRNNTHNKIIIFIYSTFFQKLNWNMRIVIFSVRRVFLFYNIYDQLIIHTFRVL